MHKKDFIKILLAGTGCFLAGAVFTAGAVFYILKTALIEEKECVLPYEQAVKSFPRRAAALGWSVRTVPCGLPVPVPGQRIMVFEICSREYANRILNNASSRKSASILPCKIAVYEKDGKVWISRLNGKAAAFLLGGEFKNTFLRHVLPEQEMMLFDLLNRKEENDSQK